MQKTKIKYSIKNSKKAKRVSVAVYCDGSVVVTLPYKIKDNLVEKLIEEKSDWILDKIRSFKTKNKISFKKAYNKENKDRAFELVSEKLNFFAEQFNFKYNKISIRNQKTRWGSCSKNGNLSFNFRILFLPEKIRNYIIIHELCHLKEFNHSKNFWKLVEDIMPEYKKIKNDLKRYSVF